MTIDQLLDKLKLGAKYEQKCELSHKDCDILLKHIEALKNVITEQNDNLIKIKKETKEKGKKK